MNSVEMTIINPWKEYLPSRERASDLHFASPACYRLSYAGLAVQDNKLCTKCIISRVTQ